MNKQNNADHTEILKRIDEVNGKLDETFVSKAEFGPVQKIAYTLVGVICLGVVGAIIDLVINR